MKNKNYVFYYMVLSISATFLLITLVFLGSFNISTIIWYDKLFIGVLLVLCCIFGISLAFSPGWFKRYLKMEKNVLKTQKTERKRRGHHPDCNQFQDHTLQLKNKKFCTGCLGLSIGCVLSIILVTIYIMVNINFTATVLYLSLILGLIMIFLAYIEIVFSEKYLVFHIVSNVTLVLGFIMVTISIFEIKGDKIYGVLGIIISVLWLDTRIQLSNYRHSSICSDCVKKCKMY